MQCDIDRQYVFSVPFIFCINEVFTWFLPDRYSKIYFPIFCFKTKFLSIQISSLIICTLFLSSLFIPIFYYLNTYQFYLFAYNGNYRLELLCTADKFPYLPSSNICLGFPASSLYNYICSTLSKSKFIFKPSTLSDSSKK